MSPNDAAVARIMQYTRWKHRVPDLCNSFWYIESMSFESGNFNRFTQNKIANQALKIPNPITKRRIPAHLRRGILVTILLPRSSLYLSEFNCYHTFRAEMSSLPSLSGLSPLTDAQVQQCMFLVIALIAVTLVHATWDKYTRKPPPVINPPSLFDFTGMSEKRDFLQRSYEIIHDPTRQNFSRPYSVYSDYGPLMLLPPTLADEIKNDSKLSFFKNIEDVNDHFSDIVANNANGELEFSRFASWL